MSTVSVINVKHPSSASNNLVLDNAGNAAFAGTAAMASSFLRNRIINGAMEIDQRNAGASFSSGVGAITYGLDRFYLFSLGAAITGQQVNPSLAGFPNAIRLTGAGGATYSEVGQRIESVNIADLAGSTVTISFFAAASVATSVNVYTSYPNSVNAFNGAQTNISITPVAINSTLTRYTVSVTLPAQAANGLIVGWYFPSGLTSGTFTLTGAQLEVGTVATPFERRQFGAELVLCQRYYQNIDVLNNTYLAQYGGGPNGFFGTFIPYTQTMRAIPTGAYVGLGGGASYWVVVGTFAVSSNSTANISIETAPDGCRMRQSPAGSGGTAPANGLVYAWEATFRITLSAEL